MLPVPCPNLGPGCFLCSPLAAPIGALSHGSNPLKTSGGINHTKPLLIMICRGTNIRELGLWMRMKQGGRKWGTRMLTVPNPGALLRHSLSRACSHYPRKGPRKAQWSLPWPRTLRRRAAGPRVLCTASRPSRSKLPSPPASPSPAPGCRLQEREGDTERCKQGHRGGVAGCTGRLGSGAVPQPRSRSWRPCDMAGTLRHCPGRPPGRAPRSCTRAWDFPTRRPRGLPSRRRRVAWSPPRARPQVRVVAAAGQRRQAAPRNGPHPEALEAAMARAKPAR